MTTFYTSYVQNTQDNLFYRTKCEYSYTTSATSYTITFTVSLEKKGTYKNNAGSPDKRGAYASYKINSESIKNLTTQKPTTGSTDWTTVNSSGQLTRTINRANGKDTYFDLAITVVSITGLSNKAVFQVELRMLLLIMLMAALVFRQNKRNIMELLLLFLRLNQQEPIISFIIGIQILLIVELLIVLVLHIQEMRH